MASDVVMPQMGESIAGGTIVGWIKKAGDSVARDEPLFEISTDKVDAEIPSPAAGVLTEIRAHEGETVPVNSVVAIIAPAGTKPSAPQTPPAPEHATLPPAPEPQADGAPTTQAARVPEASSATGPHPAVSAPSQDALSSSAEDRLRHKSSPLVRRIAQEHQVDISHVQGTGVSGRVTKNDILAYIESP